MSQDERLMFFGTTQIKLDSQYRFLSPRDLTTAMGNSGEAKVLSAPDGKAIDIFPAPYFDAYFKRFLNRRDLTPIQKQIAIDGYFSRANTIGMDKSYRLTVPVSLRSIFDKAGTKEAILWGRGTMYRLIPVPYWEELNQQLQEQLKDIMPKVELSAFGDGFFGDPSPAHTAGGVDDPYGMGNDS